MTPQQPLHPFGGLPPPFPLPPPPPPPNFFPSWPYLVPYALPYSHQYPHQHSQYPPPVPSAFPPPPAPSFALPGQPLYASLQPQPSFDQIIPGAHETSHSPSSCPMKLDGVAGAGVSPLLPWPGYRQQRPIQLQNVEGATNVYVRLLPPEARDSDLQALGARFGNVLSETCCKGVGFILFRDAAEAERAVVGLNCEGFEASYAKESLSLKLRRLGDEASTNLYLTNLPFHYDEQDVVDLLAPAQVLSVRLMREHDAQPRDEREDRGESKGIGFARLEDRESADETIARLNGAQLPGALLPLRIRYADTREQRQLKQQLGPGRRPKALGSSSASVQQYRQAGSPLGSPSPSKGDTPASSGFNTPTKAFGGTRSMQWTPTPSPATSPMQASPSKPSTSRAQHQGYFDRPPAPTFLPSHSRFPSAFPSPHCSDPFQTSQLAHYPAPSPPLDPSFALLAEQETAAFYGRNAGFGPPLKPMSLPLSGLAQPSDAGSVATSANAMCDSALSVTDSTFSFGCCGSTGVGSSSAGPFKTTFFENEEEEQEWEMGGVGAGRLGDGLGGGLKEGNGPGSEAWMLRRLESRKSLP